MNVSTLSVGAPTYNKYRKEWVSHVKFALNDGDLDFKKINLMAQGWPGSVSYTAVLVSSGSTFYLSFRADSLSAFAGTYPVVFKIEGAASLSFEVDFLSYIKPFYSAKWDAGERPTFKIGECSCVTIEVVGMKPGAEYTLKNVLRKTKQVITTMSFTANEAGIYRTRSDAEIPDNFPSGAYDVTFHGPGLATAGVTVDYFYIEPRLAPPVEPIPPPVEPIPPPVEPIPPPEKCPPDRPSCPTGTHLEPVYGSGMVMPGDCRIVDWECIDNPVGGGPGNGGTPVPPKPSCSILWAAPYSGKIGSRKQGDATAVKLTVINLVPGGEFRLQNVHEKDGVISEMKVAADEDGVVSFEDSESLLPFDWPLGSYSIRLLGPGVSLICGGFKMSQGTPVCAPGMVLGPGGQCLPVAVDSKLWIFLAVVAAVFLLSRR